MPAVRKRNHCHPDGEEKALVWTGKENESFRISEYFGNMKCNYLSGPQAGKWDSNSQPFHESIITFLPAIQNLGNPKWSNSKPFPVSFLAGFFFLSQQLYSSCEGTVKTLHGCWWRTCHRNCKRFWLKRSGDNSLLPSNDCLYDSLSHNPKRHCFPVANLQFLQSSSGSL